MTLEAHNKLMSLTDVSEMLGIPVHTLYRWRYKGHGPAGYRVGRHVRYRERLSKLGWSSGLTSVARMRQMTPGAALCARGWRLNSIHRRPRANLEASKINYSRLDYEAPGRGISG
jgi:predicted DNA-binding transcriptional regulator AlpA